jgi:hypothetical protein
MVDPNTIYSLRRLTSKKKTRELVMTTGRVSPFGVSTTINTDEGLLPVDFTKYGNVSLRMAAGNLPPGEYAIGKPYGPAVFCFGAD